MAGVLFVRRSRHSRIRFSAEPGGAFRRQHVEEAGKKEQDGEDAPRNARFPAAVDGAPPAVDPEGHGEEHEAEEEEEDVLRVIVRIKEGHVYPEEVCGGAEDEEGHGLLEGFHPCSGFGKVFGQDGEGSQHDVGQGHAEPHHGEAEHDAQRGLEHGGADGLPQERGAARGGNDGGQGAGPEGAGIAFFMLEFAAHRRGLDAYFKDAEHAQPQGQHQPQQAEVHPWVFKPECPVDDPFSAAAQPEVAAEYSGSGGGGPVEHVRFQGDQDGSDDPEGDHDAEYEGEGMGQHFFSFPAAQLDKAHDFEPDDREDARHDVQDDAAEEHEEHDFRQTHYGGGGNGRFGGGRYGGFLPRCGEGGIGGGDADAFIAYAKDAGKA